ncbi:MAG: FAD-dependent oxidoreductase [Alphaproteobacteria bacterium]|nr:FAD-dependent oxidoreductase [Alphaproteobacteria bacterium]
MTVELPTRADVVVIGAGVVGTSAAYHLAAAGAGDVVLLETARIGAGTTWHAAANMETYRSDPRLHDMIVYALDLFPKLEAESGQAIGWRASGRVTFTADRDRFAAMRSVPARTRARGIDIELIGREEIARRLPIINPAGLEGGLWVPSDGRLDPTGLATAFARAARRRGAQVVEGVRSAAIRTRGGRIAGVATPQGEIACTAVVVAAGLWSRDVAATCGVQLPMMALQHFYLLTKPIAGLARDLPLFLSYDERIYGREDVGGLLMGVFDSDAIPVEPADLPADFAFSLLPENWNQISDNIRVVMNRFPILERAEIRTLVNGPESFTPDGQMLLGPAPDIGGLFLACAMNSNGIALASGAGRAVAELIVAGRSSIDVTRFDPRRFARFQSTRAYLRQRIPEIPTAMCGAVDAAGEFTTARGLCRSPLHEALRERGAVFETCAGVERPAWFAAPGDDDRWTAVAREVARAGAQSALVDRSGDAKLRLEGPGAAALLRRLCGVTALHAEQVARAAPFLDARGGVQAMPLVLRLGEAAWLLVAEPDQAIRLADWIREVGAANPGWILTDVSAALAAIELVGPRAATSLAALAGEETAAPHAPGVHRASVGVVPCEVAVVDPRSHVLVLCATDLAGSLLDALENAGIVAIGRLAADTLRVRQAIPRFGRDITPAIDATAAGLVGALDGDGHLGQGAIRAAPAGRVLRLFRLRGAHSGDLADEPILAHGRFAGFVTSGTLVPDTHGATLFALVDAAADPAALELVVDGATRPLEPLVR